MKKTKLVWTEIYCASEHTEKLNEAIQKLAKDNPGWELDISLDWELVDIHLEPWSVKRSDLLGQPGLEAVIVEDLEGEVIVTFAPVKKDSFPDEEALKLAKEVEEE